MATGQRHLNCHQDVAYITVYFSDNMIAHFIVNWLSPVKVRTTLLGGEKRMVVWNDLEADEKDQSLRQGRRDQERRGRFARQLSLRRHVGAQGRTRQEALAAETRYFIHCINSGEVSFNDGIAGFAGGQASQLPDLWSSK